MDELLDALFKVTTERELFALLDHYIATQGLSKEQAAGIDEIWHGSQGDVKGNAQEIYNAYAAVLGTPQEPADEVKNYVSGFTSEKDLIDRISNARLSGAEAIQAYKAETMKPDWQTQMKFRAWQQMEAQRPEQERIAGEQAKLEYGKQLVPLMNYVAQSPYLTEAEKAQVAGAQNVRGQGLTYEDQLQVLASKAMEREAQTQQRGFGEEQSARALLGGMQGRIKSPLRGDTRRMPAGEPQLLSHLKQFGYAPGSQLSQFIAGELGELGTAIEPTRKAWWKELNTPEIEESTYASEQGRITSEMDRWARIAEVAPTAESTGETYWGPGGLAAIAQQAYEAGQGNLAALRLEDFYEGGTGGVAPGASAESRNRQIAAWLNIRGLSPEYRRDFRWNEKWGENPVKSGDPLQANLNKRKQGGYLSRYYRQTPAQRGYSAGRYVPSVRF